LAKLDRSNLLRTVNRLEAREAQKFAESMEKWFEERRKMSELRKDFDAQQIGDGGIFAEEKAIQSESLPTENLDAIDKITNVLRFEQFEPNNVEELDESGINGAATKIMVDRGRKSDSDSTMITRI
jgi:hypothetical protein